MNPILNIPKSPLDSPELQTDEPIVIRNNGFFPDINLTEVRQAMRADGLTTHARLKNAVIEAMATVNHELRTLNNGDYSDLARIPADEINGESIMLTRYKRAVFCFAMANLYERYRSFDTTKEGMEKAQEFENSVADLRRDGRFAIRDLLNTHRWTVALI